ncbi:MAG: RNA polymerase sigma factor [Prosthecobacter sp.]
MSATVSSHTRWSLVQAAKGDTPQARAALAELCEAYYAPVFGQMRRWLSSEDEARDVTQAFFAHVLGGNRLNGADAARGRFRSYLHAAARHFILGHQRSKTAEKRGASALQNDDALLEELPDGSQSAPDAEFDRAWACAVLKRTLDALEMEMNASGRASTFAILKPWLAGDAGHGETARAATELGISEMAVRVQLSRLRKRLRDILEQTLADTLAPGGDVQVELREMMAALRR